MLFALHLCSLIGWSLRRWILFCASLSSSFKRASEVVTWLWNFENSMQHYFSLTQVDKRGLTQKTNPYYKYCACRFDKRKLLQQTNRKARKFRTTCKPTVVREFLSSPLQTNCSAWLLHWFDKQCSCHLHSQQGSRKISPNMQVLQWKQEFVTPTVRHTLGNGLFLLN